MNRLAVPALCALAAAAGSASAQLYSEGISGDLANVPFAAPMVVVPGGGVTWAARGVIVPNLPDVDFITIVVPFATTSLIFDFDHLNSPLEDGVMGVGAANAFPLPAFTNDDDLDVPLDALCGHAIAPRDSLVDVGALLGNPPLIAPNTYTIAMGRTGEQFIGWNGTSNMFLKLEYQLYVYAQPVPAPAALASIAAAGLLPLRRRRAR